MFNLFIKPGLTFGIIILIFAGCKEKAEVDETPIVREVLIPTFTVPSGDSVELTNYLSIYSRLNASSDELLNYYQNRGWKYVWFNETGIKEQAGFFINLLRNLSAEGIKDSIDMLSVSESLFVLLSGQDYEYSGGDSLCQKLEYLLTAQYFLYADMVYRGLNEITTKSLNWFIKRERITIDNLLDSLVLKGPEAFTSSIPHHPQYVKLKLEAIQLDKIKDAEWPPLELKDSIRFFELNDTSEVIASIQYRLHLLGDLDSIISVGLYDSITEIAVKSFQKRHGLHVDGQAGKFFLEALNVSPKERIEQIYINMERYRWLPHKMVGNYITVNIPEYKMYIYEEDTLAWEMNIIVGANSSGTTIFNDKLEYIVFSPYWIVPSSIIKNEIIPAMIKDSTYLSRNNMELFSFKSKETLHLESLDWGQYRTRDIPYGIRQLPGAGNSLGWVKFLFPNQYYIYFHDTPGKNLFSHTQRNFSHGCIRLSEPKKLAAYLLRNDSTWTEAYLDSVMYSMEETFVPLEEAIPVFITYLTSWVDTAGILQFRSDIYKHDATLKSALKRELINDINLK